MKKIYVEPDLEMVYFTFERIMTGSIDGTELLGPTDPSMGFSQPGSIPEVDPWG